MQRKIGIAAIKNNPKMYIKFVTTMMIYFYEFFYTKTDPYYQAIPFYYDHYYLLKSYGAVLREYKNPPDTKYIRITEDGFKRKIEVVPTRVQKIHERLVEIQHSVFFFLPTKNLWLLLFIYIFFKNTFILYKTRYKNEWSFV